MPCDLWRWSRQEWPRATCGVQRSSLRARTRCCAPARPSRHRSSSRSSGPPRSRSALGRVSLASATSAERHVAHGGPACDLGLLRRDFGSAGLRGRRLHLSPVEHRGRRRVQRQRQGRRRSRLRSRLPARLRRLPLRPLHRSPARGRISPVRRSNRRRTSHRRRRPRRGRSLPPRRRHDQAGVTVTTIIHTRVRPAMTTWPTAKGRVRKRAARKDQDALRLRDRRRRCAPRSTAARLTAAHSPRPGVVQPPP
jgi:hypothetical protein